MDDWSREHLTFDHDRDSDFPLDGAHRRVDCADYHNRDQAPERFTLRAIGRACRDCHEDPHKGILGTTCATCHQEEGWTGEHLRFDHNQDSDFPLDGLHRTLACSACHTEPDHRYRAAGSACETCHTFQNQALASTLTGIVLPPDPHHGRVTCTECHDTTRTRQSSASYADRCADCHTNAYRRLFYQWQQHLHARGNDLQRRIGFHNLALQQLIPGQEP